MMIDQIKSSCSITECAVGKEKEMLVIEEAAASSNPSA
jgi:hypothetical protein